MFPSILEQLREAARATEVGTLTGPQAVALVDIAAEIERIAAGVKALAAARAAETQQWRAGTAKSAGEWLAARTGTSVGAANRVLEAAQLGSELVDTLTVEQAAVIAAAPEPARDGLVAAAGRVGVRELKQQVAATQPDRTAEIHRRRALREWTDEHNVWHLHASGPKLTGAMFMARLRPFIDAEFNRARADGRRESVDAYAFDALQAMSASGGSSKSPAKVIVRCDLTALRRGAVDDGETCEIAGYGAVPVDAVRDVLGESALALVLTDGVDIVNVTHFGRKPLVHQQTALEWAQPTCIVDRCSATVRLERDHRIEWHVTKHTRYDELDRLCHTHHGMKTRGKQVRAP